MGNAVFEELGSVNAVAEAFVEGAKMALAVQDGGSVEADVFVRHLHDVTAELAAPLIGSCDDPADPSASGVVEDPQRRSGPKVVVEPKVLGAAEKITSVQLVVRAVLLDHEDVDSQSQQCIEVDGGQIGPGDDAGDRVGNSSSGGHPRSLADSWPMDTDPRPGVRRTT